ncbi:hypothetical protein F5B20DRAFT_537447 [Whalleya microplaca]|nr:hypothetical protein F5B20DRAFT_537447 [Whalleya microplaca]
MDRDEDSGSVFENYPFAWILIPLIILVAAGTLLVFYRYRRRQKLRRLYGTNALERDLEAMGQRASARPPNDPRVRGGHRTGRRRRSLNNPGPEEGLNELGEPPPAYTAPRKHPDDSEDIELTPMEHPGSTTTTVDASTSSPPAYDAAQQGTDQAQPGAPPATTDTPAPPPRAVLSPN